MEKKKNFLISAAYYLTIAGAIYLIFKYAVFVVMPFIIGFIVAAVLSPAVKVLTRRFRMKRKPTAIFILILFYTTVGMLASVISVQLALKLGELSRGLPSLYRSNIEPAITGIIRAVNDFISKVTRESDADFQRTVSDLLYQAKGALGTAVSDISVKLITKLSSFAAGIPKFVIELVFAVISGFFFICDFDKLMELIKSRLPKKAVGMMLELGQMMLSQGAKYLRSYLLIMLITFSELFVGLLLTGTPNAFAWSAAIALLDFLPVIGSGAVMIPWACADLILGNTGHGIGLLAVWGVITVVRNVIEPKIVGKQMGLHPLVTLVAMFVGTKLFGLLGLVLLPVAVSIALPVIARRAREKQSEARDSSA